MAEIKTLNYKGCNFWGNPVFQLEDREVYLQDLNGGEGSLALYWNTPLSDPDGEPNFPVKVKEGVELMIKDYNVKTHKMTREEKKLILAKMIAANEYVEGKNSVEWVDFASSIHDLELTKELLKELKEYPIDLEFYPARGWVMRESSIDPQTHYLRMTERVI